MSNRAISDHSSNTKTIKQYASEENKGYPYTYPFIYYDYQEARDISDHSSNTKDVSDPG